MNKSNFKTNSFDPAAKCVCVDSVWGKATMTPSAHCVTGHPTLNYSCNLNFEE